MVHFFLNNDDNHTKVYGATFQKYWRLFLIILNLIIQLRQQINSCIARDFSVTCLARNKFLTVQANYMIIIWLVLWFIWRENKEKIDKLYGKLYGSFIVYITLVWLAYWVLLSSGDSYSGFDGITNIVQHYFTPIVMIIDWLYTEKKRYEWNYYYIWSIYPTLYAISAILNGYLDLEYGYLYDFLDPGNPGGWLMTWSYVVGVYIFYTILAFSFIGINRKFLTNSP